MAAIEVLLSFPDWLGILLMMLFTTAVGIPIYLLSHHLKRRAFNLVHIPIRKSSSSIPAV